VDDLIPLYETHDTFGFILVSGKEVMFYHKNQYETTLLKKESLHLFKQHKKGGQSAARFGRLAASRRERVVTAVMEMVWGVGSRYVEDIRYERVGRGV